MKEKIKLRLYLLFFLVFIVSILFTFIIKSHGHSRLISYWLQLPNLPFTQEFNVTLGWQKQDTNYILTIGGRINGITSSEVLMFNTVSNQYRLLTPLPIPLERAGGFILKDSIYIVGGSSNSGNNFGNHVFKLDLTGPTFWIPKNNFPMNIGEITYSTTALNDNIAYVVGGSNGINALNNTFVYNVAADNWFPATPLPTSGKYGGGLAVADDSTLIFIGGRNAGSISSQMYKGVVDDLNPALINWTTGPQYPAGSVYYLGVWGAKDGNVFITGGSSSINPQIDNNRATNKTYRFNSSTGSYDTLSEKPTPITHSQIYGFDTNPSPPPKTYEVYAPGGSNVNNRSALDSHEVLIVIDTNISNITPIGCELPGNFTLKQNYPNPFNPITNIVFGIPHDDQVSLKVFDIKGRLVILLLNKRLTEGFYRVEFNSINLASGVYFYRLSFGEFEKTRRMVLLK